MEERRGFRTTSHVPRATNSPHNPRSFNKQQDPQGTTRPCEESRSLEVSEDKAASLRNFRDLKVWQMAKEIAVDVYKATKHFPQEEIYGLSSQMRRAAISVSSNIAEGFNRFYRKDYQRFLMIALGSCGELESQIEVGAKLNYISSDMLASLVEKLNHENRMLRKLHSKMDEKKRPAVQNNASPESQNAGPIQY